MRSLISMTIVFTLVFCAAVFAATPFESFFADKSMRIDYFHTGDAVTEIFSVDQIFEEPYWGGNKTNLIDTLNFGKYLVKVFDVSTNQLIFSRGYSTVFGEWQTTEEAKDEYRTFHETVLIPYPKRSVQVVIAVRDKHNYFVDRFSTIIDPESRLVNRENHVALEVKTVFQNGDPAHKVDVVILAEGYNELEQTKFDRDVKKYVLELFKVSPFKEHRKDFNIYAVPIVSQDSGIDEPRKNIWKNTALGASYNSLDSPRYILSSHNQAIRDAAANTPYDQIYILVNSNRYGGGGIYNWYSTCITGSENDVQSWWPAYVFVHEFGHSFGGLGDEYYSSSVSYSEFYPTNVEPWEPNVTALSDKNNLKWGTLIDGTTPIPTPWSKVRYDSLVQLQRSLDQANKEYETEYPRIQKEIRATLRADKYAEKVGCFEGAGYVAKGLYRPGVDCRMFSKSLSDFCPVCRVAIEKVIAFQCQ